MGTQAHRFRLLWEREAPNWQEHCKFYWPKASTYQTNTSKLRGLVSLDCSFERCETIRLEWTKTQALFLGQVKLPDFFYIKQTRALNEMHSLSVQLLNKLRSRSNPNNAYDSEWGQARIRDLARSVMESDISLNPESARRVLSRKSIPAWYNQKPEMEKDAFVVEVIKDNIDQEENRLLIKKAALAVWVLIVLLLAIHATILLSISH